MRQRRPADPMDPGDAADLSIMGYLLRALLQRSFAPAPSLNLFNIRARALENQYFLNQPAESFESR
jgi:hypothetical protein